jgi:hypothetical protein
MNGINIDYNDYVKSAKKSINENQGSVLLYSVFSTVIFVMKNKGCKNNLTLN